MENQTAVKLEIISLLENPHFRKMNFDGETIPGYLVVAYYEGITEDVGLDIYKWEDLYRAHKIYLELEETDDAIDFAEALERAKN